MRQKVSKRIREERYRSLQRANEALERKLEAQTRALQEKQMLLMQSEKMAALGQLMADVAHEINTPLGAMKSNNDTLIRSIERLQCILTDPAMPGAVRAHSQLQRILANIQQLNEVNKTAVDRITRIVDTLRKFVRLDQTAADSVDLHEGLESTLTLVHHALKNRIEVRRDYGDLPPVCCHPNQINQVFMNILVNASQAIEDTGTIHIKTYTRDDKAVVEVTDSGKGIARENLSRIFEPGFTTKRSGVGTGLGLSIVRQIIEDHHGEIKVESEPGKGTTFRIILPAK